MGVFQDYKTAVAKIKSDAAIAREGVISYGGNGAVSDAYRNQWQRGIASGAGQVDQGRGAFDQGLGLSSQSRGNQMEAARMQYDAATGQVPSQAQELMSYAGDQQARAMMAQAQAARGGNAASAMRNAQYQASQSNLGMSQQLAALRAQEMAQARGAYGDISGQIRGQDLATSGLGTQMASAGAGREGNYLGMLGNQLGSESDNRLRLEMARMGQAQAAKDAKSRGFGQLLGAAGAVVGGIYGGPAGAAAGGSAGSYLGGKL